MTTETNTPSPQPHADDVNRARKILATAYTALVSAVRGVGDGQWTAPTPCAQWDVTQVVQHAVGDQQAYVRSITGSGGPTEDPFAPSSTIDGDPVDAVEDAVETAGAAWAAYDSESADTPLPQGRLPLPVAMGAAALDALVHAWDIAVATGQPSPLTDADVAVLQPVADALVEPLRQWGAYGPVVEAGGGPADRFLGYLGRDPHWTC